MTPFNATIRWSQALSHLLRRVGRTFLSPRELAFANARRNRTTCPPLRPHHSTHNMTEWDRAHEQKHVGRRLKQLKFSRVQFGTYGKMVASPKDTLRQMIQFFELPYDDELAVRAVHLVGQRKKQLKQGVTKKRVEQLLSLKQRAYAHQMAVYRHPFYLPIISAMSPKEVGVELNRSQLTLWDTSGSRTLFDECWTSPLDQQQMLQNTTCHDSWQLALLTNPLRAIDSVRQLIHHSNEEYGNGNGVIRLHLDGNIKGQFKACDAVGSSETWKAEM